MARVLIYSLVFPPDGVSTARLMGDLAEDLVAHGHQVSVITTQPHYNRDRAAEAEQPLQPRWRGLLFESRFRGIQVLHTAMPRSRSRWYSRARGWLHFHLLGFLAALREVPAPDVIIVPSPLLTAGLVAWAVNRFRGGCYVYNVQELYPDLAVQLGWIRNPIIIGILHRLERFVYRHAGAVTGISRAICERVSERGGRCVAVIPNFVDVREVVAGVRENSFAEEWDLSGSFVVSYAGNFGHAQGLQTLLDAAAACGDPRVRFVLVGSGVLGASLADQVRQRHLANVLLVDHQPYSRMPEIYGASDVCLVPLLGSISGSALPSKVFRIMAAERPVVAVCEPSSDLAELIDASGAGIVVPPGDPDALLGAIESLADCERRRQEMGHAGRAFVGEHFTREVVTRQYAELVTSLSPQAVP